MASRPKYREDVWYQIGGDVNASTYGATIARSDGFGIELRRIEPVREAVGDREAAEVGYPYWSSEAYVEPDELSGNLAEMLAQVEELDLNSELIWEPGPSGWAADVLPVPGAQASRIKWWQPQGHGFSEDEGEFRREILGR